MNGFFFIDKKLGDSSFDVVRGVRRATGIKKVGHSGTLDPLATGLLMVAVGEATKLLEYLIGCDKEYEVVAKFNSVSATFDSEGPITDGGSDVLVERSELEHLISQKFLGDIEQVPPKYSALKIAGRRACDIVREGGEVEMNSREVRIDEFEIIDWNWPVVKFRVNCGSGTYIRSLVHDLGRELACGAYVQELRRTRIGKFFLADVSADIMSIEDLGRRAFDCIDLSDQEVNGLQDGCSIMNTKVVQGTHVLAYFQGKVLGVLLGMAGGMVRFKKQIISALD